MTLAEIVDTQDDIIKQQADIIKDMAYQLLQAGSVEDAPQMGGEADERH